MSTTEQHILRKDIEASFAASLEQRVARSSGIQLHQVIPNHWFSAAGSECVSMYVGGYFYGCISIAQAYVEALSKYLIEHHKLKNSKDVCIKWQRLLDGNYVTKEAHAAAMEIFGDRNDYHHLNKNISQEYQQLEKRAKQCIEPAHKSKSPGSGLKKNRPETGGVVD